MWNQILPGLRINIFATILFGIVYPLVITGICQVAFPRLRVDEPKDLPLGNQPQP